MAHRSRRRGQESQLIDQRFERATVYWSLIRESHTGPRHANGRTRGRTHVSTRPCATLSSKNLLAWSAEEKARIVQETYAPGMSVSLVARQHGVAPNQVFTRRRFYAEGALSAIGAGEEVVPASEYRGSPYTATDTRALARHIGLVPCTTPPIKRHGGSLRQNLQTGLRAGQCEARPGQRAAPARRLVRALQQRASAQGAGLPFAARVQETVHRRDDRGRGRRCASTA
jgi:transposase-like protein